MTLPEKPIRRSQSSDQLDNEINNVLENMLEADTTITYREIVRSISSISSVSSLTRDDYRRALVEHYQVAQKERRNWVSTQRKSSNKNLIKSLSDRDLELAAADERIQLLTASHKATILAVGELGGMQAWLRFFDNYQKALGILEINKRSPLVSERASHLAGGHPVVRQQLGQGAGLLRRQAREHVLQVGVRIVPVQAG